MTLARELPAEGVVDYKYVVLKHVFLSDTWVQGVQILPDNPRVLHHCNMAYVKPLEKFTMNNFITGTVPGGEAMTLDKGVGFRIPAGTVLLLQVHYVTTGKKEKCQISVGFKYASGTIDKHLRFHLLDKLDAVSQYSEVASLIVEDAEGKVLLSTRSATPRPAVELAEFLGADFRYGPVWLGVAVPTQLAWDGGARWFRCDVTELEAVAGEPVTRQGSLAGALASGEPLRLGKLIGEGQSFMSTILPSGKRAGARGLPDVLGAWLLAAYDDMPTSTGLVLEAVDDIRRTAELAIEHGYQLNTHAIGDRANRVVLDIYEEAFVQNGNPPDLGWRIEHAQHIDPADIPRFGQLGVIASMEGIHCTSDAPFVLPRLGPKRAEEGAYVWQKLLKSGAVINNGTDAPVEVGEPLPSRDHSEIMLRAMGVEVERDGGTIRLGSRRTLRSALLTISGDPSSAAFALGGLVVADAAPQLDHLEPLEVAQGLRGRADGVVDRLGDRHVRCADDLGLHVRMLAGHGRTPPTDGKRRGRSARRHAVNNASPGQLTPVA